MTHQVLSRQRCRAEMTTKAFSLFCLKRERNKSKNSSLLNPSTLECFAGKMSCLQDICSISVNAQ